MARRRNTPLVSFIKRWRLGFAWVTVWTYVFALPLTIIVFPANSMWLGLLVLFGGFTSSMLALGDMLINAEDSKPSTE